MGQLWDFFDRRTELADEAKAKIETYAHRMAEAGEDSPEGQALVAELADRRFSFIWMSEIWLREAFEALGSKPLPENLDDAPSELADPSLVNEILTFWRTIPLAHSPHRPT